MFTIKVKTVSGRLLELPIEHSNTIEDLKIIIDSYEKIPPMQQKIIFNGHILTNDKEELRKYNMQTGNVVHMVLALRGG